MKRQITNSSDNSELKSGDIAKVSGAKKVIFRAIMLVLPVIILVLTEFILNIFNYGGNLDLFILQKEGNITEYLLNKNFTSRYFYQKGIVTPLPLTQTFSAEKSEQTYRIFCIGESSVQGFPYPPNAGFPAMLKHILSSLHPAKNIEVVNCGITAITSFSVLDISEEILNKYKPDLIVVYTGHNEFYGVFGSASRLSLFENPSAVRLFLKLQKYKLFLLTRDVVNYVFGKDISREDMAQHKTFMGVVAQNKGIRNTDEIIKKTENAFMENIECIVEKAKKNNTDIILCSLASNKKDFPPFSSMHNENLSPENLNRWHQIISQADSFRKAGQNSEAISLYKKAIKLDPFFAETHYYLAECYYNEKKFVEVKKHYDLANDYDVIRFRASVKMNKILQDLSAKNNIPFADVNSYLSQRSSQAGIAGKELLTDHVHPNNLGYLLTAKKIALTMSENKMIQKSWDWSGELSDSVYLSKSNLSLLDHEIVNYSLFRLKSYWPFNENHRKAAYVRVGNERTEQLAKEYSEGKGDLIEYHLKYGLELDNQNELADALAEYNAALSIIPIAETYNRLGKLYLKKTEIAYRNLKDFNKASENFKYSEYYFKKGLNRWSDYPELNFNLGLLYMMRQDKFNEAEYFLKKVLDINPVHKNSYLQLGNLYIKTRQTEKARILLHDAISQFPGDGDFYTLFGISLMLNRRINEAKDYFEKAVALTNNKQAKYFLSKINNQ